MGWNVTGRRSVGLVVTLALALAGCAVEPTVDAPRTAPTAVTAIASAPDAAGQRTWWLFFDHQGVSVQASSVGEALLRAGLPVDSRSSLKVTENENEKKKEEQTLEQSPGGSYSIASVGIGGGGR